jgi:hypothetical protein
MEKNLKRGLTGKTLSQGVQKTLHFYICKLEDFFNIAD